jgi:hypothetical protein
MFCQLDSLASWMPVPVVSEYCCLGLWFNNACNWSTHLEKTLEKLQRVNIGLTVWKSRHHAAESAWKSSASCCSHVFAKLFGGAPRVGFPGSSLTVHMIITDTCRVLPPDLGIRQGPAFIPTIVLYVAQVLITTRLLEPDCNSLQQHYNWQLQRPTISHLTTTAYFTLTTTKLQPDYNKATTVVFLWCCCSLLCWSECILNCWHDGALESVLH